MDISKKPLTSESVSKLDMSQSDRILAIFKHKLQHRKFLVCVFFVCFLRLALICVKQRNAFSENFSCRFEF